MADPVLPVREAAPEPAQIPRGVYWARHASDPEGAWTMLVRVKSTVIPLVLDNCPSNAKSGVEFDSYGVILGPRVEAPPTGPSN